MSKNDRSIDDQLAELAADTGEHHVAVTFTLNEVTNTVVLPSRTLASDAIRHHLRKTGTHVGCEHGVCGACTVHLNGAPVRSCITPISAAAGQKITTIEAIAADDKVGKAVHAAWVKHDVAQCGYCQSGQVMSATALLRAKRRPTDADIDQAMAGNVCRCGTYARIRAAIKDAAASLA